jgi:hypothetical protein
MIHFKEPANLLSICSENNINRIIIPLAMDTLANCSLYRTVAQTFPDLDKKFAEVINGKTLKPGNYIRVQIDNGHIIYFIIIRVIEKFQPYIFDIIKALDQVMNTIKRELSDSNLQKANVLFPMPIGDELKLSDSIFIPAICDKLNTEELDVYITSNGDHEQYIEKIHDYIIYYKRDSWKTDWMLTLDDIILMEIINNVIILCHDFKINKSNLIMCYHVCHLNGMFPKLEFYPTEFGQFFKLFLPKSNSLINHGLLLNNHHYSNTEPKKFSCVIGPMYPHLKNIAYTRLRQNKDKINMIANLIKVEHIKAYQNKGGDNSFQKMIRQPADNQSPFQS